QKVTEVLDLLPHPELSQVGLDTGKPT
ncbi:biopolymer transporter ExbD, partial [Pseudomonas aeruginosa]